MRTPTLAHIRKFLTLKCVKTSNNLQILMSKVNICQRPLVSGFIYSAINLWSKSANVKRLLLQRLEIVGRMDTHSFSSLKKKWQSMIIILIAREIVEQHPSISVLKD